MNKLFTSEQKAIVKEIAHEASKIQTDRMMVEVKSEVIPRTVEETLKRLGIDASNPLEAQADQAHLRKSRRRSEKIEDLKMGVLSKVAAGLILSALLFYFGSTITTAVKAKVQNEQSIPKG